MTTTIYTTGYAGKSLPNLIRLLDKLNADLFDIRLQPWSRVAHWRKPTLESVLGSRYRHVGALGNVNYRGGPIQIANLQEGIQAIEADPRPVILLCGCREPQHCHRTVVGNHLRQLGFQVEEVAIPQAINTIKAITLWQPWTSLIAHGFKHYETRGWSTNYRGWLAIHAAKRKLEWFAAAAARLGNEWDALPTGAVVAVARLTDVHTTDDRTFVERLTVQERSFGDYSAGRYAWKLENIRRLAKPIVVAGTQGLWDLEAPGDTLSLL